jgi:U4/U6 small nuclear ribonucleoprotein PRP3
LHPLLSGTSETSRPISNKDRYKPMQPKFATTMVRIAPRRRPGPLIHLAYLVPRSQANARSIVPTPPPVVKMSLEASSAPTLEEARKNPYFDRRLGVESLAPKQRKSRALKFAQKGKFTNLAENLRAEARQQELRERIAAMSQKAGMDNVMDGTERRAKRPPPPEVEWWDAKLLPNETYDDLDTGEAETVIVKEDPEKGISRYVQHPMKIPAPQDKVKVELKPLLLTTKERKKLRRTTRRAEQQDKQDRIRMGLLPPEPPKIKIGNMMRVLTQEAVMDPTKVEARVRREMNQRNDAHVKANEERKLTPAERTAKLAAKVEQDAHRGLQAAVYKIGHLANGGHKFKVIKNAQQHQLTGAILFSPKFVFVLVEGGEKAMRKYSHLLLERIDWAEEEPPAHMPADADFDDPAPKKAGELERDSTNGIAPGENYCTQIWSGMHRERAFDKLRLKSVVRRRACSSSRLALTLIAQPSDHLAREWLGQNLEGLWELCRTRVDQSAM